MVRSTQFGGVTRGLLLQSEKGVLVCALLYLFRGGLVRLFHGNRVVGVIRRGSCDLILLPAVRVFGRVFRRATYNAQNQGGLVSFEILYVRRYLPSFSMFNMLLHSSDFCSVSG